MNPMQSPNTGVGQNLSNPRAASSCSHLSAGSRCAPDCSHTDEEHDAFDMGYEHGYECKTDNPFRESDPLEWSKAYEEGNYAGRLSHGEDCLTADEVAMGIHFENNEVCDATRSHD